MHNFNTTATNIDRGFRRALPAISNNALVLVENAQGIADLLAEALNDDAWFARPQGGVRLFAHGSVHDAWFWGCSA